MFNNKLHLGTLFGLILSAPTILMMLLTATESGSNEGFYILVGICLALITSCIGFFSKQVWALKLTSFMIIGVYALLLFTILYENGMANETFELLGIIVTMSVFTFGSVALLNNDIVLEKFGAKETYDDLDDILDA